MDNHEHGCKKIGRRLAVLCAFFGAVTAWVILVALGFNPLVSGALRVEIVGGLIMLFIGAAWLGTKAGLYLCRRGCSDGMHLLVGIGVAFGSIAFSVLGGTVIYIATSAAHNGINSSNLQFLLLVPLVMFSTYGGIPAICLGVLYGFLIKKELSNIDYYA